MSDNRFEQLSQSLQDILDFKNGDTSKAIVRIRSTEDKLFKQDEATYDHNQEAVYVAK